MNDNNDSIDDDDDLLYTFENTITEVPQAIRFSSDELKSSRKRKRHHKKHKKKKKHKKQKQIINILDDDDDDVNDEAEVVDKERDPLLVDDFDDDDDGGSAKYRAHVAMHDPTLRSVAQKLRIIDNSLTRMTPNKRMSKLEDDLLLRELSNEPKPCCLRLKMPNSRKRTLKIMNNEKLEKVTTKLEKEYKMNSGTLRLLDKDGNEMELTCTFEELDLDSNHMYMTRVVETHDDDSDDEVELVMRLQIVHEGETSLHSVPSEQPLDAILSKLERESNYDRNSLGFYFNGIALSRRITPTEAGLNDMDMLVVEMDIGDDGNGDVNNGSNKNNENVILVSININNEKIAVRINSDEPFSVLVKKLERKYHLTEGSLSLEFDGDTCDPNETPADMEMEEEDQLDTRIQEEN